MTQPASITFSPYREPLRATLTRTVAIAVVMGGIVAFATGRPRLWPALAVVMLWPALGGHWVELFFLKVVRPRLAARGTARNIARVVLWFVGGMVLAIGARWTALLLLPSARLIQLSWAVAGAGFIAIELVAHAGLRLRGRPSFYDGRG